MSNPNMERVVSDFARMIGTEPWTEDEKVFAKFADADVCLARSDDPEWPFLTVYCEEGVPKDEEQLAGMLTRNAMLGGACEGGFGIHPLTGQIVFRLDVPVRDETTGEHVLMAMATAIDQARECLHPAIN